MLRGKALGLGPYGPYGPFMQQPDKLAHAIISVVLNLHTVGHGMPANHSGAPLRRIPFIDGVEHTSKGGVALGAG